MKRIIKLIPAMILIAVVTVLGIMNYKSSSIPLNPPIPILKYNNVDITVTQGEDTWIDNKDSGSTNLTLDPFKLTKDIDPIKVNPNDSISFNYTSKTKPQSIFIRHYISPNEAKPHAEYTNVSGGKFKIPSEKGIYILNINAMWDKTHTTSHIFKIIID